MEGGQEEAGVGVQRTPGRAVQATVMSMHFIPSIMESHEEF